MPVTFATCALLLKRLRRESFDLLLLDWMLPDMTGLDVLAWTKAHIEPSPPTIIVTAKVNHWDVVTALRSGADDYVTKPILEGVLKARVEALLRRTYGLDGRSQTETYGDYVFNPIDHKLSIHGRTTETPTKIFELGLLFFRNLGRPLSRDYIAENIWHSTPDGRTLDTHIAQVRRHLNLTPENGFRLSAVYGFGYRLERLPRCH